MSVQHKVEFTNGDSVIFRGLDADMLPSTATWEAPVVLSQQTDAGFEVHVIVPDPTGMEGGQAAWDTLVGYDNARVILESERKAVGVTELATPEPDPAAKQAAEEGAEEAARQDTNDARELPVFKKLVTMQQSIFEWLLYATKASAEAALAARASAGDVADFAAATGRYEAYAAMHRALQEALQQGGPPSARFEF